MAKEFKTKIIAHRGASSEAPENTLSSFKRAIALGVDAIELDIYLTKDDVPIVYHDAVFGRTSNGHYLKTSSDFTYDELQHLDAGSWFHSTFANERIPMLEEVLNLIEGKIPLMLEFKKQPRPAKQVVDGIFKILKKYPEKFLIGSFDPKLIAEVIKSHGDYPVIGIVEDGDYLKIFKEMGVKHFALSFELLSEELIHGLHEEGCEVWTFTVDSPMFAAYLSKIPVDGIITNNPARLKAVL